MASNQSSKKRKASQELEPETLGWDRTTYRVRNIPQQHDRLQLSKAIATALGLEDLASVKVHSLASQGFGEPRDQVATAPFRRHPSKLPGPTKEWQIELKEDDGQGKLFIDTRFNNFTLLSSGESVSEEEQIIEWVLKSLLM